MRFVMTTQNALLADRALAAPPNFAGDRRGWTTPSVDNPLLRTLASSN